MMSCTVGRLSSKRGEIGRGSTSGTPVRIAARSPTGTNASARSTERGTDERYQTGTRSPSTSST